MQLCSGIQPQILPAVEEIQLIVLLPSGGAGTPPVTSGTAPGQHREAVPGYWHDLQEEIFNLLQSRKSQYRLSG